MAGDTLLEKCAKRGDPFVKEACIALAQHRMTETTEEKIK